jgi:hypothetical protein
MPIPESRLLLNEHDAKCALNVDDGTLNQLIQYGKLNPISIHGKVRFLAREISQYFFPPQLPA